MVPSASKIHLSAVEQEGNALLGWTQPPLALASRRPPAPSAGSLMLDMMDGWGGRGSSARMARPPPDQADASCSPQKPQVQGGERPRENPEPANAKISLLPGKRLPLCLGSTRTYSINFPLGDTLLSPMGGVLRKPRHLIEPGW